jgi:phage-related minor tail protein
MTPVPWDYEAIREFNEEYERLGKNRLQLDLEEVEKRAAMWRKSVDDVAKLEEWLTKKRGEIIMDNLPRDVERAIDIVDAQWRESKWALQMTPAPWMKETQNAWAEWCKQTSDQLRFTFTDPIFDAMTGRLDSFEDYWRSVWESMSRVAANYLSQLAFEGLGAGLFGGAGGGGGIIGAIGNLVKSLFGGGAPAAAPTVALQEGGIVTKPTFAVLGEVPEIVMPLDKFDKMVERSGSERPINIYNTINVQTRDGKLPAESRNQILTDVGIATREALRRHG